MFISITIQLLLISALYRFHIYKITIKYISKLSLNTAYNIAFLYLISFKTLSSYRYCCFSAKDLIKAIIPETHISPPKHFLITKVSIKAAT